MLIAKAREREWQAVAPLNEALRSGDPDSVLSLGGGYRFGEYEGQLDQYGWTPPGQFVQFFEEGLVPVQPEDSQERLITLQLIPSFQTALAAPGLGVILKHAARYAREADAKSGVDLLTDMTSESRQYQVSVMNLVSCIEKDTTGKPVSPFERMMVYSELLHLIDVGVGSDVSTNHKVDLLRTMLQQMKLAPLEPPS